MTTPTVEADVVWLVEREDVCTIWRATREVFGNSRWHSDVDQTLDVDKYREYVDLVEELSDQSLFDCVLDAVSGLYPADPSEVFAAMHRQFATYGVDLQFEDHDRYGDLLVRAAKLTSRAPVTEPQRMRELDTAG